MTALIAIFCFPNLIYGENNIFLYFIGAVPSCSIMDFLNDSAEPGLPFIKVNNLDRHNFMFLYIDWQKRSKHTIFINGINNLIH